MAISYAGDDSADNGTATTIVKAFTGGVTAGDLLVAAIWTNTSGDQLTGSPAVDDSLTQTWTRVAGTATGEVTTSSKWIYLYYFENSAGGACTVTAHLAASQAGQMVIAKISGIATSSSLDQFAGVGDQTTTTPSSGNVTTTQADEILIGFFGGIVDESAATAGASFTLGEVVSNNRVLLEYRIVASTGTYAAPWVSASGNEARASIATFKGAAAGGGTVSPSVNDAVTIAEDITMKMHLSNTSTNDTATVTESITMHMPIYIPLVKS